MDRPRRNGDGLRMWRYLLILFLLSPVWAAAQVETDSMAVEAKLARMPAEEGLEFLKAEVQRKLRNDPHAALELAHRYYDLAESLGDDLSQITAHLDLGAAHYYLGEYQEALRNYEAALALAEDLQNHVLIARSLNNIGILYFVWGEHDLALQFYFRALPILLETGDRDGAARTYNNIAGVHQTAGNYESAHEYYRLSLAAYVEVGNATYEAAALNNIGLILYDTGRYGEAIATLDEALVLERREGDRHGESLSLNNKGLVRAGQGRLGEAEGFLTEALAIRRETSDLQGESVTLQALGSVLVDQGRIAEGIALLEEALAIAQELEVLELIRDDLLALSEAWETAGNQDRALEHYRLYKEAHDRIFDEERSRQMAAAETRFEVDLKDKEIEVLHREAEFQEFRRKIMLVGALASVVIMGLLWNRNRFQKRANRVIQAKNDALGLAHSELEKAAREELAHVSRVATMGELAAAFAHELNQPLMAIKANARAARNLRGPVEGGPDEVDEALQDIREDSERAREIIIRLREMMRKGVERRELHGIDKVIRTGVGFIQATARSKGVAIDLDLKEGLPPVRCDHIQLQQVLVNLLQNALAAMEGLEGEIVVTTDRSAEDGVVVRVVDQGPPVPPEVVSEMFDPFFTTKEEGLGMGLPICRTIIEAHGGTLRPIRNEDRGLTMEFQLPIPNQSV
jgi:signal transduction histidine kinase/Tfp pilus assembly protein PilF